MSTDQSVATEKRLVTFTVSVLRLAKEHENNRTLAPVLNQLIRSSGSIGANVSEANGALTKLGFARYFRIALQSANETKYWLQVLEEFGSIDADVLQTLSNELTEFIRILRASLRTMDNSEQD
jgi:four helix bundle protein